MSKQLSQEEFIDLVVEQQTRFHLDETQQKFIDLIKEQGICVHMSKEGKESPQYQELTALLGDLHQNGIIPNFQIVSE